MDDIAVRTVIIGVNIFVTVLIVTIVVIMFFQMGEIYGVVATTDTSIYNKFDDIYSIYHGKVESGVGLLNTIKKFEENPDQYVIIEYPGFVEVRGLLNGTRESVYLKNEMLSETKNQDLSIKYNYEER